MKDNLDKDIEKIKLARMKPEEKYLHDVFTYFVKSISKSTLSGSNSTLYKDNNNNVIFEYCLEGNVFYYDFDIERLLKSKFNMNDDDIFNLMKKSIKYHLKIDTDLISSTTLFLI
jgi:hypothetical protein